MFLQQRGFQLVSGKGGVCCECQGVMLQMTYCRKKRSPHPPLTQEAAHWIQKMLEVPALWDHLISGSKHLCVLFTYFWRLNKQLCVQRGSRVFICFIVHTSNLTLTGCVWYFVPVDSFMVSESSSIKITATRKEQLSYHAALSSYLLIASGQMSPL